MLLLATVAGAGVVATSAFSVMPPEPLPVAALALSVDPVDDRITLTHRGGEPLDVSDVTIRIKVDGDPLAYQPPVPFVGAPGFRGAPTGPFNLAGDQHWTVGEQASLRLAATNDPDVAPGSTVVVSVYYNELLFAELSETV